MSQGEAKTKLVIDVGDGAKSLRTLKQEFKETQKELDNTIVGTKEYTASLKKLADIKDEIEDLNKTITAFRPDQKLAAFVGVGRGMAAGFEAATASAALFGGEAKEVEQAMLKVQSAMALANAIQEVGEIGKQFKLLGQIIKAAFSANPLGAILTAITAIATISAGIFEKYFSYTAKLKEEVENQKKIVQLEKDKLGLIDKAHDFYIKQGYTEQQILTAKKKQLEIALMAIKKEMESQIMLQQKQEQTARANQYLLKGILEFVSAPLAIILKGIDRISAWVGEATHLADDVYGGIASMVFDPAKTKEEGDKELDVIKKQYQDAYLELEGFNDKVEVKKEAAHKESIDKRKLEYGEQIDLLKDFNKQMAKEKQDAIDAQQKIQDEEDAKQIQSLKDLKQRIKEEEEKELKHKQLVEQAKYSVAQSAMSSISSLAKIAGVEGENMVELQKGLALTQIAIDTAKAISSVVSAAAANPTNALDFGTTMIIQTAAGIATVLANIAQAKAILESGTTPSSISVGGGSSSGSPAPPRLNQVGNTSTNLSNINNQPVSHRPVRAYVVETDSTAAQKRVSKIEERSKF